MVSHEQLLEHIIRMCNPEKQNFEVGTHIFTVDVEDIYFLTGLSRWGAPLSLTGSHKGGHYYSGVDRLSLHSWDQDIGEENSHKISGGWPFTDHVVYHAESGGKPRSTPGV